jgi:hypothetical protein
LKLKMKRTAIVNAKSGCLNNFVRKWQWCLGNGFQLFQESAGATWMHTHTLLNGFLPLLSTWVDKLSATGFREAGNGEPAKVAELPRRRQWRTLDRSVLRRSTIDSSHVPSRSTFRSGCDVWEVLWAWISENGFVRKFWTHKIISSSQVTFRFAHRWLLAKLPLDFQPSEDQSSSIDTNGVILIRTPSTFWIARGALFIDSVIFFIGWSSLSLRNFLLRMCFAYRIRNCQMGFTCNMQVQLQFAIEGAQFEANWGGVSGHQKGFRSWGKRRLFSKRN